MLVCEATEMQGTQRGEIPRSHIMDSYRRYSYTVWGNLEIIRFLSIQSALNGAIPAALKIWIICYRASAVEKDINFSERQYSTEPLPSLA